MANASQGAAHAETSTKNRVSAVTLDRDGATERLRSVVGPCARIDGIRHELELDLADRFTVEDHDGLAAVRGIAIGGGADRVAAGRDVVKLRGRGRVLAAEQVPRRVLRLAPCVRRRDV